MLLCVITVRQHSSIAILVIAILVIAASVFWSEIQMRLY